MPLRLLAREKVPALALAMVLQAGAIWLLVHSLIVPLPEEKSAAHETQVVFLPLFNPPPVPPSRKRKPQGGSNATAFYFNPYTFDPKAVAAPAPQKLTYALSACDVDKYDMAPDEIRAACDRIGALIRHDPGRFGFTSEVVDAGHWQRELARREAPVLLPCMSPDGVDVLYTLTCIYEEIFTGHREDKRRRYSD